MSSNAQVIIRAKDMTTGAFSRNVSKLFYELKLVTDNILSMQQPTEKPLKNISSIVCFDRIIAFKVLYRCISIRSGWGLYIHLIHLQSAHEHCLV